MFETFLFASHPYFLSVSILCLCYFACSNSCWESWSFPRVSRFSSMLGVASVGCGARTSSWLTLGLLSCMLPCMLSSCSLKMYWRMWKASFSFGLGSLSMGSNIPYSCGGESSFGASCMRVSSCILSLSLPCACAGGSSFGVSYFVSTSTSSCEVSTRISIVLNWLWKNSLLLGHLLLLGFFML